MHAEDATSFADLLRRHRQTAGLTQQELAERAGVSVRGLADLERGARRAPHRDTVALLAEALALVPRDRAAFTSAARRPLTQPPDAPERPAGEAVPAAPAPAPMVARGGFLGALPAGPLVGREAELDRLLEALDAVADGRGRLLLLAGEPGVGKTRLAQELMVRAGERGFRVLTGRCYEQHTSLPFFPFIEALTAALSVASPALRQETPRRFPYLGRLLPDLLDAPPTREGEDVRLRIWHAVGGFLAALASEAPLAVLLDDLHWADSASLELLLHLARRVHGDRVLLLGTYRDVEVNRQHPLEAALGELMRERLVEELSLRGLTVTGTGTLIGAHFGLSEVSEELRDLLHARTEGNPFFLEEVLKALVEQGAIYPAGAGWDRHAIGEIDVPRSIRAVVGRRVGRLAPDAQETLRMAGVLGQEWELDLLLGVAGADEEAVLRHLEAALAVRLLEERRVGRRERYAFAHALIGQALYEEVPRFRLRRLHLRAGEALERLSGERAEAWAELARHFLAAGEEERATRYAVLAGDHAAGLYAQAEAVQHYEAALEMLGETGDEIGATQVREKLGTVLYTAGRYDMALAVLDRAAQTYRAAPDLEGLGRVTAAIGWMHQWRGTPEEGIGRIQEVLAAVEVRGPSPALAALCLVLARLCFFSGRADEARAASERAMDLAQVIGDDRLLVEAAAILSTTLLKAGRATMAGRAGQALRLAEEATQQAGALGPSESLWGALVVVAYESTVCGGFGASSGYYQRAVEVAERLGDPNAITFATAMRGWLAFLLGEWDRAQVDSERAMAVSRQAGVPWAAAYALLHRGQLRLAEGRWQEASPYLEEAAALAERGRDLQARRQVAGLLAELEILTGRPGEARSRLIPLLDRPGLEEYDATALLPVLAWAHLALGELEQATQVVEKAIKRTRPEGLRLALLETLWVQAQIRLRQGRLADAEKPLDEGLALARAMPYPYAEARLLSVYGRLVVEQGEPARARERLEAALAIFRRLGARKDLEQTERALAAFG